MNAARQRSLRLEEVASASAQSMEHLLSVRISNGPAKLMRAETTLGPSPQLGIPEFFQGKLRGVSAEQILEIKFGKDVVVSFEGRSYQFSKLDKDGAFDLTKAW